MNKISVAVSALILLCTWTSNLAPAAADPVVISDPVAPSEATSNEGHVLITSDPPGASVTVGKRADRQFLGTTPLFAPLAPREHRIVLRKEGHSTERRDLRLSPGGTRNLHVDLYRSKRLIHIGFAIFWPGVVTTVPAGALRVTEQTPASNALFAVSGTLIAVGTTLLITGTIRRHKEEKAKRRARSINAPSAGPTAEAQVLF